MKIISSIALLSLGLANYHSIAQASRQNSKKRPMTSISDYWSSSTSDSQSPHLTLSQKNAIHEINLLRTQVREFDFSNDKTAYNRHMAFLKALEDSINLKKNVASSSHSSIDDTWKEEVKLLLIKSRKSDEIYLNPQEKHLVLQTLLGEDYQPTDKIPSLRLMADSFVEGLQLKTQAKKSRKSLKSSSSSSQNRLAPSKSNKSLANKENAFPASATNMPSGTGSKALNIKKESSGIQLGEQTPGSKISKNMKTNKPVNALDVYSSWNSNDSTNPMTPESKISSSYTPAPSVGKASSSKSSVKNTSSETTPTLTSEICLENVIRSPNSMSHTSENSYKILNSRSPLQLVQKSVSFKSDKKLEVDKTPKPVISKTSSIESPNESQSSSLVINSQEIQSEISNSPSKTSSKSQFSTLCLENPSVNSDKMESDVRKASYKESENIEILESKDLVHEDDGENVAGISSLAVDQSILISPNTLSQECESNNINAIKNQNLSYLSTFGPQIDQTQRLGTLSYFENGSFKGHLIPIRSESETGKPSEIIHTYLLANLKSFFAPLKTDSIKSRLQTFMEFIKNAEGKNLITKRKANILVVMILISSTLLIQPQTIQGLTFSPGKIANMKTIGSIYVASASKKTLLLTTLKKISNQITSQLAIGLGPLLNYLMLTGAYYNDNGTQSCSLNTDAKSLSDIIKNLSDYIPKISKFHYNFDCNKSSESISESTDYACKTVSEIPPHFDSSTGLPGSSTMPILPQKRPNLALFEKIGLNMSGTPAKRVRRNICVPENIFSPTEPNYETLIEKHEKLAINESDTNLKLQTDEIESGYGNRIQSELESIRGKDGINNQSKVRVHLEDSYIGGNYIIFRLAGVILRLLKRQKIEIP